MAVIYSWKTNKVANGYSWTVSAITPRKTQNKMGQYADTKALKRGVEPSRAKAKTTAIKWVRHFKSK